MKLFQQLLVAPAALGLMAPVAATAAELNVNGVSEYSNPGQVESISNFSDVHPSDWAFQALNNLRQRHGCAAANPNSSMTRYEAAALLNKCLGNVAQVNEEEQSLIDEFGAELAVIRGRLDVLENDMDGIEAGVFSTTTKLSGSTTFVIGGIGTNRGTGSHHGTAGTANSPEQHEAVVFNYDTKIALESSFNGDDLFVNRIRVGNTTAADPFGANGVAALESASSTADALQIDRSYYQFPIADDWTATIGARVRQDDMLGVWPSDYPSDSVLDVLTYAGANDTYNLALGAGAGVTWTNDNLVASTLFVSENADNASSQEATAGGVLTAQGADTVTTQLAWVEDNFTVAAAYTSDDNGNWNDSIDEGDYSAWGLSGVYRLDNENEWVPSSISAGYGWKSVDNEDPTDSAANRIEDSTTWSLGFLWNDAFTDGNNLGLGLGTAEGHRDDTGYDDPLAWEVFYQMAVSDNITVTPAIFVIQRDSERNDDVTGALVKTTFTF
ncbi:iron uptake porin [Prochlorococcus sp. MIT 1307]|uniref:iron uptake porin n=1 Tax=Prochlorococcus sp. MIT 1307 TaxID=3096219 RepID=UPI002A75CB1B|nr:iron uptake porin [Prochlorococcus sp. MIT 1307]